MGVDYELFWTLTPKELTPFSKAHFIRQKQIDTNNWALGKYFAMAIGNSFSKSTKYPEKPFLYSASPDEPTVVGKQDLGKKKRLEIKEKMLMRMAYVNSKFKGVN